MAARCISPLQRRGFFIPCQFLSSQPRSTIFGRSSRVMMKYLSNTLIGSNSRTVLSRSFKVVFLAASGISLFILKSYYTGRWTGQCQSHQELPNVTTELPGAPKELEHIMELSETAKLSVQEFGLAQRLFLAARLLYLCFLFSPAALMYGVSHVLGSPSLACCGWRYIMAVLQTAGPAFIKLGQWASTRRDIFTEDFCRALSELHVHCHSHSWEDTVIQLDSSLGQDWSSWLLITDHTPIGSGSVAQVYQGVLRVEGRDVDGGVEGRDVDSGVERDVAVAVKVLHPNVVSRVKRDIYLMKYVASWIQAVFPDVHWVALTDCVDEFSSIMEKQLDLKLEARNLEKFRRNMVDYSNIKFPAPIYPYVTKEVLVESFESGTQISEYIKNPGGDLQKSLAKIGIEALLDMLFVYNFVHGDLHPGNILVQNCDRPKLVLLDCGIATSLAPVDWENMHCVFMAIVRNEGHKIADLFLNNQQCSTLHEYRSKMAALVNGAVSDLNLEKVHVDQLFSDLFNVLIEHKVRIDPNFTSVMAAIMVIEGLGRALDPSLDILAYARPCLLHRTKKTIRDRVFHRLRNINPD